MVVPRGLEPLYLSILVSKTSASAVPPRDMEGSLRLALRLAASKAGVLLLDYEPWFTRKESNLDHQIQRLVSYH